MHLYGVDIYIWHDTMPDLPKKFQEFELKIISNKGTKIYPPPAPNIEMTDIYRCRYLSNEQISSEKVNTLMTYITEQGLIWTQCIKLYVKDNVEQFSQPY